MSTATRQIELGTGQHAVHFYRDLNELGGVVGTYLAGAVAGGAVAVVIATQSHVRTFERELAAAGADVGELRACGRLVVLDADETLASLIVRGEIDREAFRRVVGTLMARACESNRPVRAYGEMVDLLWRAGDLSGAIELETLWNELLSQERFALLCAYRSESAPKPEHEDVLRKICGLHTARAVSRGFRVDDDAPRAARRFLEDTLGRWGHGERVADDARLLVSELVTNAVIHARTPLSVSISTHEASLRLAVQDASSAEPTLRSEAPDAPSGRGLRIVAAVSRSWGVDVTPRGKTVWAEL